MAARVHTTPAAPSATVPAPDVARMEVGASRLKALHDEAVAAVPTDRGAINADAWTRARAMAAASGETVRACLGRAMREAWAAARAIVSAEPEVVALPAPAPLPSLASALSRRSAIFGAVVVGAAPAAALAANAGQSGIAQSDSDAELIALGREWQASADRCDRARVAMDNAAFRTEDVPFPEAVFVRPGDDWRLLRLAWTRHDGRRWYSCADKVKALGGSEPTSLGRVLDDEACMRRAEIAVAWEDWTAETARREAASGYTAAEAEENASNEVNREVRRRILALPALTLAGVMVKARVSGWCYGGSGEMRYDVDSEVRSGNITAETMATSLAADLVAMLERAA